MPWGAPLLSAGAGRCLKVLYDLVLPAQVAEWPFGQGGVEAMLSSHLRLSQPVQDLWSCILLLLGLHLFIAVGIDQLT